jgi:branched-subunit amino acid transport protein
MSWHEAAIIAGMALVTFGIRYTLFALGERAAFPVLVRRALRYVPVAVLTAITTPMLLLPDGQHWQLDWHNAYLVGGIAAGLIAWRWRRLLATLAGGLATFFFWRWLVLR